MLAPRASLSRFPLMPVLALFLALFFSPAAEAKPTPIINFSPATVSVPTSTSIGTVLTTMVVTLTNGATFTGSTALTNTGSSTCTKTGLQIKLGTNRAAGTRTCTVTATQSGVTVSTQIAITLTSVTTPPVPIVVFNPAAPSVFDSTAVNTPLSAISVTMSDGSSFNGSLSFGGTYGNDGGICAIVGTNLTLGKSFPAGNSTQNCSVVAAQGTASTAANIAITVTGITVTVVLGTPAPSIQTTAPVGTVLSTINTTISDGSLFTGTLAFGSPNNNGGGACALAPPGTTITAPTTNTLTDSDGTWSFGPTVVDAYGYQVFLNGVAHGTAILVLSYSGHTYDNTLQGYWFEWIAGNWSYIGTTDPRPVGATNVVLGKTLTAGTDNCTVVATQGTKTGSAGIAITVMSPATPVITFGTSAPSVFDNAAVGVPLSTIVVTMSDGSTFSGSLGFGTPYNNDGGICAIVGTNLTLGKPLPAGSSTQHCTIAATQGSTTTTGNIAITVIGPTPTVTFSPTSVSIPNSTLAGSFLSNVNVTLSDGSMFTGGLAFGSPNNNGGGACSLDPIVAPTTNTLIDSDGTWSFGAGPPTQYGYPILRNSAATGGVATLILSYNGQTYVQTSPTPGWYQWNGSGYTFLGTTDPRPPGTATSIVLGKTLTAATYNCTVTATQGLASASGNIAITATASSPTPTVHLGTTTTTIQSGASNGTPLSTIAVSMSDGSTFSGTLQLAGTFGNGGGRCALSSTTLPANVTVAGVSTLIPPTNGTLTDSSGNVWSFGTTVTTFGTNVLLNGGPVPGGSEAVILLLFNGHIYAQNAVNVGQWFLWNGTAYVTASDPRVGTFNCTVVATQGSQTASANIAVTVTAATLTLTANPASPTIPDSTRVGRILTALTTTVSDGSMFVGALGFGAPYSNDGGICALAPAQGISIVAPTTNTLTDVDGTWSFGPGPPTQFGYPLLINGAQTGGGVANLILSYNSYTYVQTSPTPGWYQWNGSGYTYIGTTDPRPAGATGINLVLGQTLPIGTSTQNCTVTATQ